MSFNHDLASDLTTPYGGRYCIMSAMNVESFNHPKWKKPFGPSMSFPQLFLKDYIQKNKVLNVNNNWSNERGEINFILATVNDARDDSVVGIILPTSDNGGWSYYLEYMKPTEWNIGLNNSILVIRRIKGTRSAYLGKINVPSEVNDKNTWTEPSGNVTFQVKRVDGNEKEISINASKN